MTDPDAALRAAVLEALEDVADPELAIGIVAMGLVREVSSVGGRVRVDLTFTSLGCPWTEVMTEAVRNRVREVSGVREVVVHEVWDRRWDPSHLRADARRRFLEMGIAT